MSANPRTANGNARRKLRKFVAAQGLPCHICGSPIDYTLPAGDPLSYELDEIVPVSLGGSPLDPANVAPAHRICNQRKGNKMGFRIADRYKAAGRTADPGRGRPSHGKYAERFGVGVGGLPDEVRRAIDADRPSREW